MNNQVEYEALLFGFEFLQSMGMKHVETYRDSLLVVQQISKVCQCYSGSLNAYLDKCFEIISFFDEFVIRHIPRAKNGEAIARQASSYVVVKQYFHIRKPMRANAKLLILDQPVRPVVVTGLT